MRIKLRLYIQILILAFISSSCVSYLFPQNHLNVPYYSQRRDQIWGLDTLGRQSNVSINTHGCALSSSAMVLSYHGIKQTPGTLNRWLAHNGGYAAAYSGSNFFGYINLDWSALLRISPRITTHKFYNWRNVPADLDIIKQYIRQGKPVIAEVRWRNAPHFIVLIGYEGDKFYMHDPNQPEQKILNSFYNYSDAHGSGPARNIYSIHVIY